MKVCFLPEADQETNEAARHYNHQRSGLGNEFLSEIEAAVERLKPDPLSWQIVDDEVRRCRTRRFPYDILFQVRPDNILIVAVMHQHRDPDYWKDRLPDEPS